MIAFRLILLRIKFTTCATCHAFYLKRYQTSCSFCVYIVSTHHATILIASLILQIPASPTISTQTPPNSPTSPNSPLPASLILQIPHLPINLNTTPPNSPTSPNFPLPASLILQFPTSPTISTQRHPILQIPLHTLPILYPIRLKSPYNPPWLAHSPYSTLHTLPILYPIRLKSPYNPPGSPYSTTSSH